MTAQEAFPISRRRILTLLFLLFAPASCKQVRIYRDFPRTRRDEIDSILWDELSRRKPAMEFGRLYLLERKDEDSVDTLKSALIDSYPESRGDERDLVWEYISDSIKADFAAGNTVSVDGWIISRTEARWYALAWKRSAMLNSKTLGEGSLTIP